MPMLIEHIDAIARKVKRDVLYIEFHPSDDFEIWKEYDYKTDPRRTKAIEWLEEHGIVWQECGQYASEYGFRSYLGEIYIDVPFDENNDTYCLVRDYLENTDGTMRDDNIRFWALAYERAMKNVHHDEPDFWEKWSEKF